MERSKLYKILGIIVGTILLIILIIVVFTLINGNKVSYSKIESSIKEATEKYYENHPEYLPGVGLSATVNASELAAEGLMDPLDELVKKETCTGTGKVYNGGGIYTYSSSLDCGKAYISVSAIDYLKSKNTIKVDRSGLYEETVSLPIISEEGKETDYIYNTNVTETTRWVYKGSTPNNYLKIGKVWYYIMSFSEQDIRLVRSGTGMISFDNSYNEETDSNSGRNIYYSSNIIKYLEKEYSNLSNDITYYVIPQNVCIGARKEESIINNGAEECSKVLVGQNIAAPAAYETSLSSVNESCKTNMKACINDNYFSNLGTSWTSTAVAGTTRKAFASNGELYSRYVNGSYGLAYVINIKPDVKLSGNGTEDDPFILEG